LVFESKSKGLISNNLIGVDKHLSTQEKAEILYHEILHYEFSNRDIIECSRSDDYLRYSLFVKE